MRHQSVGAHRSISRIVAFLAAGVVSAAGVTFADVMPAGTPSDTRLAIQDAIDAAAVANPAGTVTLGSGTFEIDAQLMVTGGVTLVGQGWENTVIKQTATGNDKRCATLEGGAKLQRVTLTGGCINGNNAPGGGVAIKDGTVSWCCITNNTAGVTSGASVYGGGVGFYQGKGQVDHSIIAGNLVNSTTALGGGVSIYQPTGAITIDTCLVIGNAATGKTAANGKGGGVYVEYMYWYADVTIRNSTIAGNSASGTALGGGVCVTGDAQSNNTRTILTNDIMSGNTSAGEENNAVLSKTDKTSYCLFGLSGEAVGTDFLSGDPLFADVTSGDYTLSSTSPAIGAGVAYEGIGIDLYKVAFANPPAMGCYELSERASEPVFNPASGSGFYPTTSVTLSCETAGAAIYYTTDGSTPTESSTPYTGPIAISATTTIKARAYKTGMRPSVDAIANYICRPQPKNFKKSVEITLNTNLAEQEITTGIPALVKLSESTISGFRYGDFSLAKGGDMMFVDNESGAVLPHEIDTWNTAGESLVWVKLPSTAENTKIVLYYGNGTVSTEESTGVWTDYVGVWHFEEATAASVADSYGTYSNSTATEGIDGNVAQYAVTNEIGRFGKCFRTNNATARQGENYNYGGVWVNDSGTDSPVDGGKNFTISGWFKHGEFNYYWDHMFYKRVASNNTGSPNNAFVVECNSQLAAPSPMARGSGAGGTAATLSGNLQGAWAYLTFVFEVNKCHVYENGVHKGDSGITACIDNDAPLVFGNNVNIASGASGDCAWNGWIDEVRYSSGLKSAEWIAAEYNAMNAGETDIFTYGEAKRAGAPSAMVIIVR